MLLLDRQTSATPQSRPAAERATLSGPAAVPAGRIQLRLCASGQVVELPPGKATIGSSPRCNVRIEQAGVQPLHCLISESSDGLRIRSWVADTTLNGKTFEEAKLAIGDCLTLGTVELLVVDSAAETIEPPPAPVSTPAVPIAQSVNNEETRVSRDQARARARRLLHSLRRERHAHSEALAQAGKLQELHLDAISEQNELSERLKGTLAELDSAREQLTELQSVEISRRELADRNEQLRVEIGDLHSQIIDLRQQQIETDNSRQQLADEHAALQEQYLQSSDEKSRLQLDIKRLADDEAAATERYRQLADEHSTLQAERDELADAKAHLAEAQNAATDEIGQLRSCNARLQADVLQLANEKATADDLNRELLAQKENVLNELGRLNNQKHELEEEREGLRRHIDTLVGETRSLAGERGSLADERTELYHECGELRRQIESLRLRITQLNEENSAMAVGKLTLVEQRDALDRQTRTLQVQLASLGEENAALAAAKMSLAEDQAQLVAEKKRLEELEREMSAVQAGRDNTSAELYRALLQLAELQERDEQSKAVLEAYESLGKERDQFHSEAEQLKSEINRLSEERTSIESAWEALSAEATTLSETQRQLAAENAQLFASLEEARQQLEAAQRDQSSLAEMTIELQQERAAKQQADAEAAAAAADAERRFAEQQQRFVEQERRLAEQERRFAEQFAEQSSQFDDRSERFTQQSQQLNATIRSLEEQLANVNEAHDILFRAHEGSDAHLADAESRCVEQLQRIAALESQLSAAERRATELSEEAASRQAARWKSESTECLEPFTRPEAASEPSSDEELSATDAGQNQTGEGDGLHRPNAWTVGSPLITLPDATVVGNNDGSSESHESSDEIPTGVRSSDWRQELPQPANAYDEPVFAQPDQPSRTDAVSESKSAERQEQASFIERYSHLFDEEDKKEAKKLPQPSEPAPPRRQEVAAREMLVGQSPPNASEAEESIEQYMAKLLQRVRGEAGIDSTEPEQPSHIPLNAPPANVEERTSPIKDSKLESEAASDINSLVVAAETKELRRPKYAPMAATDLDALRALANETARRAITRHDSKTLRRNAVSKVIVATLAAATSVWLMLASPDWRHWQFFTACGSLLVAAYWLVDSCRAFANSLRVGWQGRSAARPEGIETFGEPALPIDVEQDE
jgi:hypothetical protein